MTLTERLAVRLTGFKLQRYKDWRQVVADESRVLGRFAVAVELLKGALGIGRVNKTLWRGRIRACRHCPVYDRKLKKCRPYAGAKTGCGCYMPFKALVRQKHCWIRSIDPQSRWGSG